MLVPYKDKRHLHTAKNTSGAAAAASNSAIKSELEMDLVFKLMPLCNAGHMKILNTDAGNQYLWFSNYTKLGVLAIDLSELSYKSPVYGFSSVMSEQMHKKELESQNDMLYAVSKFRFTAKGSHWKNLDIFKDAVTALSDGSPPPRNLMNAWQVRSWVAVLSEFSRGRVVFSGGSLSEVAEVITQRFTSSDDDGLKKEIITGIRADSARYMNWLSELPFSSVHKHSSVNTEECSSHVSSLQEPVRYRLT